MQPDIATPRKISILPWICAGLLVLPAVAGAQVYKCTDDDGSIMYSQTPCPDKPSTTVDVGSNSRSDVDCRHANRFAFQAARLMQSGLSSDQLFSRYGGLDSLSKGSLSLINYVYSFRTNNDVSAERIAALSESKCSAGALGDVSCEALPLGYTESRGGCNAEEEDADTPGSESRVASTAPGLAGPLEPAATSAAASATSRQRDAEANERAAERRAACEKSARDKIDAIDARMRSGYSSEQGERYREELRGLTSKLRECKQIR